MTGIERSATDIICPSPPQCEWAAYLCVPRIQRPSAAPEHKNRTANAPPGLAIFQIMLVVKARRRSILLADHVDASGITQCFDIRRPHLGAEGI